MCICALFAHFVLPMRQQNHPKTTKIQKTPSDGNESKGINLLTLFTRYFSVE